jgi:hypothetical protein
MTHGDGLLFLARALCPLPHENGVVGALRDDIGRCVVAWESVVELASRHLVTPALHEGFADKGLLHDLPADVRSYLDAVHELNGERNRRIAEQLREIVAVLNRAGIEPVLLKGVSHLEAGLYEDPAARVIGDIDLLVPSDELAAAAGALAATGYREVGLEDFSFTAHHHHTPLAREHDVAAIELHTEPVGRTFAPLLSAERVLSTARRLSVGGHAARLPTAQDQIVHNAVHTQLADEHYWCGRAVLRPLGDLVRLRLAADGAIDWREVLEKFDDAGYGSALRAYLMTAELLFGQALPDGCRGDLASRLACWRIRSQSQHPWLMAAGEAYGYHRAMLAQLQAGPGGRRRVLARLLHPHGYRRYLRSLKTRVGRAH